MPRSYTHIKMLEKEIFEQKAQGKSKREIGEQLGLSKKQLTNLITRHNRAEAAKERGVLPRPKGRPRKDGALPNQSPNNEIQRLRMENELLRDFLHVVGKR